MSFTDAVGWTLRRALRIRGALDARTAAATITMDSKFGHVQVIDPGGTSRTVLLPPEEDGLWYVFYNSADAAEILTIKEDGNSTTFASLARGEWVVLVSNGTTWYAPAGADLLPLLWDLSTAATGTAKISLADNVANALDILEGATSYLKFVTTNAAEKIVFGKQADFSAAGFTGPFVSTEQTGTGSAQNVAHGRSYTPSAGIVTFTDLDAGLAGGAVASDVTFDATNATVTVTSGRKFRIFAF